MNQTAEQPYQLLPELLDDEFQALVESIAEHGVLVPVEYDEAGNILDGHHRVAACEKLGLESWPKIIRYDMSEIKKRMHVRVLNVARRQLSTQQKRALISAQIIDTPDISSRRIGGILGVCHKTVGRVRDNLVRRGTVPHATELEDSLGRQQRAKRPAQYVDDSPEGRNAAIVRARDIKEQNGRAQRGIGTRSASLDERGDDFYETPPEAIWALMAVEKFSETIWEPACGKGAISSVMIEAGYKFDLSDLRDRGAANQDGELARVEDFLETKRRRVTKNQPAMDIATNPPFGIVNAFIAHAMREHRPRKIAMLLNMNAMCGTENIDRNFWMDEHPPARIYVFSRRLPMMHRDGYEGPRSTSQMNTAWFIWELGKNGKYPSKPSELHRLDWKEFVPETVEVTVEND